MAAKRPSRAEYQRQRRAMLKNEQEAPANRAAQIEAEMRQSFETAKARLESGLKDLMPGSNAHRQIVIAIANLERDYRAERASRGLDPERLGGAGIAKYRFIAHVGAGGAINTVQYDTDEAFEKALAEQRTKDAERLAKANTPERIAQCAEWDKEFGFDETGHDTSYDKMKKVYDDER